ncbi:MAG: aspartate aminotransferase family protein, partial [Proteobacteria bacterium]|nr:aspartate aminotransferase family protein [Pseudomonadota bacterium]
MEELLNAAAARALRYLRGVDARSVAPARAAVERLAELGGDLPAQPTAPEAVLALLDEIGSPATMVNAGGRYFGFVNGGALPAAVAANWLATAWDQNAGPNVGSPVAQALEEVSIEWVRDLLGLPAGTGGTYVTGASTANFCGLAAARHELLRRQGWNVERDGLFGAPPIAVVVGEEVHVTLLKALSLLGLGRERVVRVAVDGQGRMRVDKLPLLSDTTLVCIQAGNVNTGAIDPARPICEAAAAADSWVHVDGAFGLWAAAAPARAALADGMALAHSWATDAHKWLNVPYDCGIVLLRDPRLLEAAMSTSASYLAGERHPFRLTPEMSRRARGVDVWAALRSLGRGGLAALIERCCRHAARFAEGLRAAGYDVLNDVVLNQVLVSFGDAATTNRVIAGLQRDGTCWCGGTVWQGKTAMRISVSSWATTDADVEMSLAA